jgi:hypothetical protein
MRWKAAGLVVLVLSVCPNSTAGASGTPSNQKGMAKPSRNPLLPIWVGPMLVRLVADYNTTAEVAVELAEASSLSSTLGLVSDLKVLTDVDIDRLEAVPAEGVEALVRDLGVGLAERVPLEGSVALLLQDLGGGGCRNCWVRAHHQEQNRRASEHTGNRRPAPHRISIGRPGQVRDSSAALPGC